MKHFVQAKDYTDPDREICVLPAKSWQPGAVIVHVEVAGVGHDLHLTADSAEELGEWLLEWAWRTKIRSLSGPAKEALTAKLAKLKEIIP